MELIPWSGWPAVNEHGTVPHQGLGVDCSFTVGYFVDNISNSCLLLPTLRAPQEVPHIQPPSSVLLITSPDWNCVYGAEHPSSSFCFLRKGFLLPPVLQVVPVVPADAHHLVLAEKSEDLFLIYFFLSVFSTLVLLSGMPGSFLIEYWVFYVKMGIGFSRVYRGSGLNMGRSFCPVKADLFPVYPHS